MLGDKDIGHSDSEFLSGVGAGEPLDRGQVEGFPIGGIGQSLDAMHRDLEELAVEGILELPLQVGLGLGRVGDRVDPAGGLAEVQAPGRGEVRPDVLGHRLEPGAEAARRSY